MVTVDVTPDGFGDAIVSEKYFVIPEQRKMKFKEFLKIFQPNNNNTNEVFYIQHQNSNFTSEFQKLWQDVDTEIKWACEAFGSSPDAINFWMGQAKAVSSLHKDHYENLVY